ncbi:MAG: cupin domain-containing protein [Opitutales bacterium]
MTKPLTSGNYSAEEVVALLGLQPLDQEGGWFRRTGESALMLPAAVLPPVPGGDRRAFSLSYALFTAAGFSALHRLAPEEVWCFHAGDALEMLQLSPLGGIRVRLGAGLAEGEQLHAVVPAGHWQGTRLVPGGRWALISMLVVPEFTWRDFELGDRAALTARYPAWSGDIAALTRAQPPSGSK